MKDGSEFFCSHCGSRNCCYNNKCIACERPLVGPEHVVADKATDLWNAFNKLPPLHPDDIATVREAINTIHNVLASRACVKMGLLGFRKGREG